MEKGEEEKEKKDWQNKVDIAYQNWKYNNLHKNIKNYFNECSQ